jgi:hypothetical protein
MSDNIRASFSKDVNTRERAQKDVDSYTGKIDSKYKKRIK